MSLALGSILVGGTLVKAILSRMGLYTDPLTKQVLKGRKTALIKGDFVVFHIGSRANRHVDGNYKWIGDAFQIMSQELEDNPDLGCLGCRILCWSDWNHFCSVLEVSRSFECVGTFQQ